MQNTKEYFDFMKLKMIGFVISIILIVGSFVSFFVKGLNFGIDFTGGLLFDITTDINIGELRETLIKGNVNDFSVQSYGANSFIIRVSQNQNDHKEVANNVKSILKDATYNKIDFVGPQVGEELIKNGIIAFILSILVISIYIWIRFEWDFSIGVIITLIHDILILFGIYSFFQIDFDLTSIAAILTVMGYSMNDTVVIYDRLREFLPKYKSETLTSIINRSLTTTFRRTLLTSSTTLISLFVLGFVGGDSIKNFSLIVFIGIIIGTYSSFLISAPALLYIKK
ncbi:MAG: protein translocase subunit SecF [Rickettsiales bacterium]|jgi:preprotein translocase SecF subunit|nr:protein translocase subunit SecF [Rickettsiales bacterium]